MSSLSWETFYNTDYAGLDDAASIWKQYIAAAAEIETALIEDIPVLKEGAGDQERDDFDGETADQVRAHARRICNQFLDDVDAYAGRIQALLEETKSGFEGKRDELADLFAEKSVYLTAKGGPGEEHFEVDESSLYNYLSGTGSFQPMNEYEANDYEQRVREQAVDMSDRFKSLMDDVRALDDDQAAAFKALNDDAPALPPYIGPSFEAKTAEYLQEVHQDMLAKIESGEATPEEVNAWWNSMPEGDQSVFTHDLPELVGPVDGIPTDDRNTANRILLDQEIAGFSPTLDTDIAALEAQLEEMRANGEQYTYSGNLGVPHVSAEYAELQAQLDELNGQRDDLDALTDLQSAITGPAPTGQDYFLLGYDTENNGGAIVSIGNPDTATNTGVFVPGTFATLDNFAGEDGALSRAEAMADDAQRLGVPGEETAIIAWLDYDTPQSASPTEAFSADSWNFSEAIPDAMWSEAAEDGGVTLNHFVDGLDATHEGGESTNTTLIAHSYGTAVIGEAAQDPNTGVDQIIGVASPGFAVDHVSELAIDPDKVWATTAEGDAIKMAPADIHGTDPDYQGTVTTGGGDVNEVHDGFGANVFPSEAFGDSGSQIHGGYWHPDNVARENMALILTGQPELIQPPKE